MFTWWMGFDIKILKTQVTGKTGLTVSLFCCLGLEDKNLRVGGGGQCGQVGGQGYCEDYLGANVVLSKRLPAQ